MNSFVMRFYVCVLWDVGMPTDLLVLFMVEERDKITPVGSDYFFTYFLW